jgi:parallel beta-helix repeat protein
MKIKILSFILILTIVTPILTISVSSTTSNVMITSKNILYVGGTGPGNYSRIQDAIDNSTNGCIIFVFSGIYMESILIEKSLEIVGQDKNNTIIDGCKNSFVVKIFSNETKINNFTIHNSIENGINIDASGCFIDNNIFQYCDYLGLSLKNSSYATITNNIIRYNERGMCLCLCCFNTTIKNNKIEKNNYCGIYIYESCDNHIFRNNVIENKCGIIFSKSHKNILYENNILLCKTCCLNFYKSSDNIIKNNNFLYSTICTFFNCCENYWNSNYWRRPRFIPYIIIGIKEININGLKTIRGPSVNIDWNPAKKPFDV